eukprot:TRINITY_DN8895_c0_g1_i1.p1 TRINITY_DN8895_c0_g1~~TRINITY_DN8895_c0_g1_i1.p1  ORF type:complete len:873 (+),score=190.11 TRINITY_DN8895_c0_g1_i1:49-2667(+)
MDERFGWRAASPTGSGRRNVSPPRTGRQSVGRQSPAGNRHIEIARLSMAADIRAGEIARLTDKTERLGERLASARSRFSRGTPVRATAELTVRGVQAVAIGDTGVVFGPSDDLSLKNGINVQWDMRRDGGSRRINVLQTDIVPAGDLSPRRDLPSSPVPLHRYSRSPVREEYHSPTRPAYTSFSPPPPTTRLGHLSSLSPTTKYSNPHSALAGDAAAAVLSSDFSKLTDVDRRADLQPSPNYNQQEFRTDPLRSPRSTRPVSLEPVAESPSATILANEVSELQRKRLNEEKRLQEKERELEMKRIEEEKRLHSHENQLSQLEQKRIEEQRKLLTSEQEVSMLQRKRLEEERLLQSNEMVISELQRKRIEEERLLFTTSSAVRNEEQRLELLTQKIRDEEDRLCRLQNATASVSPTSRFEQVSKSPEMNRSPVSPPKFPPAVPPPSGSSPTSSHGGGGKCVSSPPSERVIRERSSLSSHPRDVQTPDNVLTELRMEDSVRVEPTSNGTCTPLPKRRESASRHITFNGDQVLDQQQLDALQGEWVDARGTWHIRGTMAECSQKGKRDTYRISSDGTGNVCLDGSSLSKMANGGKTIIWTDGDIWNRPAIDCDSESTASIQLINTMRGDDTPHAVRMSMSRKSSIRGFERGVSTDRTLLSRKGSLGRILADLAESRNGDCELEIDEENVWWQVPVVDCNSVTFTHPHYGDRPPGATSAPNSGSFIRFEVGPGDKFIYTVDGEVQPTVAAITLERTEHGIFLLFPDEKDNVMPERVVCLPPEDINDLVASTISVCKKCGVLQNLNYEYEALANQEVIVERYLASKGEEVPWTFVNNLLPPNYLMEPTSNAAVAAAIMIAGLTVGEKQKDGRYCSIM